MVTSTATYRETELGQVPQDWQLAELGELFSIQQGKALSPKAREGKSPAPFLRTSNVLWGRLDLSSLDEMDFTEEQLERLSLRPRDLLVCEGGEVGRTAIWHGEVERCSYQNHLHRLRVRNSQVCPEFYMYWMQAALLLLNLYIGAANRTTIANLSKSRLSKFRVPVPSFPEQRKIAAVLGAVQEAKERAQAVIQAAKELKKSLLKYLFTYGPVPVAEAENVPLKETEIGDVPEEWEIVQLGGAAQFRNGINFTKDQKGSKGILTVDVLNMYGPGIAVDTSGLYRVDKPVKDSYLLKDGDILFVRSSLKEEGVGWPALFREQEEPVTFCGFTIRARLEEDAALYPEFLTNYARTPKARQHLVASSGRVAITNINQGRLGGLPVPRPDTEKQKRIAHVLRLADDRIAVETDRKAALEDLFKALLHDLMTARVRVNDLELPAGLLEDAAL